MTRVRPPADGPATGPGSARRRALFVFLDGVGLGPGDPAINPLARARLPTLTALLDGRAPVLEESPYHGRAASLVALDATLGVPGLPQSGTGQAALLTGRNAPALFGRHFGPWTPTALRTLVERESVLARAAAAGRAVAFANAYPEELMDALAAPTERTRLPLPARIAAPIAARAAGLLTRGTAALARGDAVASEITNDAWRERLGRLEVPVITAAGAGRNLARIATTHELTFFAHYATDTAGHRGGMAGALAALERVDAFLAGILEALPADALLIVASDHGNLEDTRAGHTRNPALCLVAGPDHRRLAARLHSLTDVAPALLEWLGVEAPGASAD